MLKNSRQHSDNFTVFEENDVKDVKVVEKCVVAETSCQTEDTTCVSADIQTDDSIAYTKDVKNDEEVSEDEQVLIEYWKKVLSGQDGDMDRIRRLNDELEEELASRQSFLGTRQDDYSTIYSSTTAYLENDEESSSFDDEDDEKDDSITVIL